MGTRKWFKPVLRGYFVRPVSWEGWLVFMLFYGTVAVVFVSNLRQFVGGAAEPVWFILVFLIFYISVLTKTDGRLANRWYPWWTKPPEIRGNNTGGLAAFMTAVERGIASSRRGERRATAERKTFSNNGGRPAISVPAGTDATARDVKMVQINTGWWRIAGVPLLLLISLYLLYGHLTERAHRNDVLAHGAQAQAGVVRASGIESVMVQWTDWPRAHRQQLGWQTLRAEERRRDGGD